MENLTKK